MRTNIKEYFSELERVFHDIDVSQIELLANLFFASLSNDSTVFVFGNGGSAATASHLACDINKGVSFGNDKRFKVICLNDNIPTMMAYANDVSYESIFVEQLKNFLRKNDLVVGFSGSGNSKNVLNAIEYANQSGAITFGMTGFDGGKLKQIARHSLVVEIDDMQKVEDTHLIITHILMRILCNKIRQG
ncbi:phosphoheptose isomerase [candidate division WOR-1 bacterium RIFOXYA2_FULL_37_7]|uniref:Phosphoheptose isomerase n=1 Tax=candidate division WOR-1 bacterium RIFOXYB2_FULL_37_13 TaxID=1802579 RepID=A0A1F4SQF0_UNCSA|nr:MAG: phosphoheptose isomerase [candidate division WOR-1 bacterium RIFOXYA2_FULL_37_7]OGC22639.1 MAG: phosphoheptose isomerase [candidate division WOR-1 bacterium RIFOXYB2_FULL_37_13]